MKCLNRIHRVTQVWYFDLRLPKSKKHSSCDWSHFGWILFLWMLCIFCAKVFHISIILTECFASTATSLEMAWATVFSGSAIKAVRHPCLRWVLVSGFNVFQKLSRPSFFRRSSAAYWRFWNWQTSLSVRHGEYTVGIQIFDILIMEALKFRTTRHVAIRISEF